jgi:hypothetical protein
MNPFHCFVGYEILSVPVRQVHMLQVPENKKLRKVFVHTKDEVRVSGYYGMRVAILRTGWLRIPFPVEAKDFSLL